MTRKERLEYCRIDMTQQRFLESILYILRYDFRDMLDEFPDLLNWDDGMPQHGPAYAHIDFRQFEHLDDFGHPNLDIHVPIYYDSRKTINRDLKKSLYIDLNEITAAWYKYHLFGHDGHLTDFGQWFAGNIERIIAYIETDSFPFVTVQYFEITEDGIDEYKNHIEDIRAYLEQEYKKYRT